MSNTIVDMPKVCQMLDNGWRVSLFKNPLGTYTAMGRRKNEGSSADELSTRGAIYTDDFTPEQALTRLAYKVHGEILDSRTEAKGESESELAALRHTADRYKELLGAVIAYLESKTKLRQAFTSHNAACARGMSEAEYQASADSTNLAIDGQEAAEQALRQLAAGGTGG